MTKSHSGPANDQDAALTLDMDMAIIGLPSASYRNYSAAIEAEYAPAYGKALYYQGRLDQFITPWLKRERFFITNLFENKYGAQARKNLEEEKLILKGHVGSNNELAP
jgi:predicted metal-dependent HD superfamily phosphohydrolase